MTETACTNTEPRTLVLIGPSETRSGLTTTRNPRLILLPEPLCMTQWGMAPDPGTGLRGGSMTSADYVRKLDELDRLLNDPDVPIQPELIWCLLDEVMNWSVGSI